MKFRLTYWSAKIKWVLAFVLLNGCLDKITFDIPESDFQTVIDGMISDNPGPYTVKLSKTFNLDADSAILNPIQHAKIKLFDDSGNEEDFTEMSKGVYMTGGVMQGQIGHSYHITVETSDGKIFQSEPEMITSGGEVEKIDHEYEARTAHVGFGDVAADVFNIYIDANAGDGVNNYIRWRYTGTYKVVAYPQFHAIFSEASAYIDPLPCSGYIVLPALGGGKLEQVAPCTCCTCWVIQHETLPQISDGQFVANNKFKHIKVGEVPVNNVTFYDKYLVVVEQMSLTKSTYDYYNLIKTQHQGSSSLFQPPYNQIKGNIYAVNTSQTPLGLFWAASVKTKYLFIDKTEVPFVLTPIDVVADACNIYYYNSTLVQPALWQ